MFGKIAFPSAERQKYNTPNNDNSNNKKWLELYHVNIFHSSYAFQRNCNCRPKKPASNQISRLAANHHTENRHKSLDESEGKK